MMPLLDNLYVALPEIIILTTACLALIAELYLGRYWRNVTFICVLIGLGCAGIVTSLSIGHAKTIILSGLYISDDLAQIMKLFICISVFLCFAYSKNYVKDREMPQGDYYILGLFSTLGMMVLVSAYSLLTIYLGLELLSLPLYAITAIRRTDSQASEASLKYFVMGAIASGMLLYGMSLLYGATASLNLAEIATKLSSDWQNERTMLIFSLVFIMVGIGFKLAAAPFHMWAPDVYEGAPASVTMLLGSAPKIAAMAMAMRLLTIGLIDIASLWQQLILVMALLSTILGNLIGIVQTKLKRLFAYSAIAHIGYSLFGLLALTQTGLAASLYYIIIYALMSVAAFAFIVLLSQKDVEISCIDDLKGLNKRNPWLAFMFLIVILSMAGIPPSAGFFIKLLVLKALVDVHMISVAVISLLFAVVGAFYYLKIIKVMYFDEPAELSAILLTKPVQIIYSCHCLLLLWIGIFPGFLFNICVNTFAS